MLQMEPYTVDDQTMLVRPGTCDAKIVDEVIGRHTYDRRYMPIGGRDEVWADLGAHIGSWSRRYAPRVSHVYAFEPSPDTYQVLQANVGQMPNVTTINAAVAREAGTAEFYRRSVTNSRDSLIPYFKRNMLDPVQVNVMAANNAVNRLGINCIKADIEGSEVELVDSINWSPIKKLVMEWSFDFHPDMRIARHAIAHLEQHFEHVKVPSTVYKTVPPDKSKPQPQPPGFEHEWPWFWYPRAVLIFAWDDE